jgi:two-component system, OmpR family, response regulator
MSRKDVLLVDDDASIREVIQMTLEVVGGWTVRLAASGPEAVQQVRERAPDAILLDLMMPGMDGPATLTRLRSVASDQNVPVILLSAKVQQRRDDQQLTGLGVAGVIAKPFDPITLPDRISTILGWAA